jgi:hypothetical protein
MTFPTTIETIAANKVDGIGMPVLAEDHNQLARIVNAIQLLLGTNAAGSFEDIATALLAAGPVVVKTSAYTAKPGEVVLCDASGGPFAITPPAGAEAGQQFWVKKSDASTNAVTVTGTLDGTVNPTLTRQWGSLWLIYDGTKWVRPDRHTLGALVNVSLGTPSDGQALVYQASTGLWIPGSPAVSGTEGDYHENVTGTPTTAAGPTGPAAGSPADVAGVTCTVPILTGSVWVYAEVFLYQSTVGTGNAFAFLTETTVGNTGVRDYDDRLLPNSTSSNAQNMGKLRLAARLGAVAAPRTFKLQIQTNSLSGTPVTKSLNAAGFPSRIWYEVK